MHTATLADTVPLQVTRHAADGTPVLMLHCSSASSSQWKPLAAQLDGSGAMPLAVDLHGHGRSPAWPAEARDTLAVDAQAAWQALGLGHEAVHLVGHSYGAAVALQMALMHPSRVRSMALYEPVPFGLLSTDHAEQAPGRLEIETVALRVAYLLDAGRAHDAGRCFSNYWADGDAWGAADAVQRDRIAARMPTVRRHFAALLALRWSAPQLRRLQMPVLLMHGTRTREPARALSWQLAGLLPRVTHVPLPGAGHLGPVSHASVVAAFFATRLRQQIGTPRALPLAA